MSRSEQFFHGTHHDVVGGSVLPGGEVGKNHLHDPYREPHENTEADQQASTHAFVSNHEEQAWDWAYRGAWAQPERLAGEGRAHVYEVHPPKDLEKGLYHEDIGEYKSRSGFPVKRRIDTMPGFQGTFPNLNWNQFKHVEAEPTDDVNHPLDREIEIGHAAAFRTPTYNRRAEEADVRSGAAIAQAFGRMRRTEPDPPPKGQGVLF